MKNLLFYSLLLYSSALFSQNWMPVVPGDLYHFRAQDSNFITHTIRIDSVKKVGPDSVFYLNRVVKVENLELDFIFVSNNQGQFLGRTMTKKPDGRLELVSDEDDTPFTVVLFPNAAVGTNWDAVADSNITATVLSVENGTVLGEADLFKTIQFSNGATWILSENHGIVQSEALFSNEKVQLSGIETRSLGEKILDFEDFFDFNVGDIFEWQFNESGIGGFSFRTEKWLIIDKQVLPDTFRYLIERRRKSVYDDGISSGTLYNLDTLWTILPKLYFKAASTYNKQNLLLPPWDFYDASTYALLFEQGKKVGNKPSLPGTQLQCALFPGDVNFTAFYFSSEWGDCCDINDLKCEGRRYYEEYRVGLGRVEYIWDLGDFREYDRLLGAVIQGDTVWGEISPDWFFTSTHAPERTKPLLVLPNPADDFIQFTAELPFDGVVRIRISDLNGKLLADREMNWNASEKLDIAQLPQGTYFVQLIHKNQVWAGKFQKI